MAQSKKKLLAQKHTGFELIAFHSNIDSLPLSVGFFFVETFLTPVSETNEISSITAFFSMRSVNHRPFLCNNPNNND